MPTRFTVSSPSLSLGHTSGYVDLHALQQLAVTRGSTKKSKALLQRKPRHLEPVNVTNQQQHYGDLGSAVGRHQPHLLDAEERSISSKQLRSLVSNAMISEKPSLKSGGETIKYAGQQRQLQPQQPTSSHERSRQLDPLLLRLDAQGYASVSTIAASAKALPAIVQEQQHRNEEDYDDSGSHKYHHIAHVRSLQHSNNQCSDEPHSVVVQDAPSNQARMQAMDLSSMHGTTLARYRRLIGMVARKNLLQILHTASQKVAFIRLQHRCATRIQSAVWSFLLQRRELHRLQALSALVVQYAWRSCQARSVAAVLKNNRDRRVRLKNLVDLREKRSAVRIQQTYRAHSERKSFVSRRNSACARLASRWRSKKARRHKNESAEQDSFLSASPKNEQAVQVGGDHQHPEWTLRQIAIWAATDPDASPFRTATCGGDEIPSHQETQMLHDDFLPMSGKPSMSATEELVVPGFQREEVTFTTVGGVSVTSLAPVVPASVQGASNLDQGLSIRFLRPTCEWANLEEDSMGAIQDASDSAVEREEPVTLSCPTSTATCDLVATSSARELSPDVDASSGEVALSGTNPSSLDVHCMTSNTPSISPRTAAKARVAERVLSRFLARWIAYSLERIRSEHHMKICACVQIQSCVRQWIAAKRVHFVRQLANRALRAELESAWFSDVSSSQSSQARETRSDGDQSSADASDEDEDGDEPSLSVSASVTWSGTTGCYAFLPARNGEIPPGVSRRQLEATNFWKWSWSVEAWTAS